MTVKMLLIYFPSYAYVPHIGQRQNKLLFSSLDEREVVRKKNSCKCLTLVPFFWLKNLVKQNVCIYFMLINLKTYKAVRKNWHLVLFCSCDIMVIQDIQEVAQYLKLKFKIRSLGIDARVSFYSIKTDENKLGLSWAKLSPNWGWNLGY